MAEATEATTTVTEAATASTTDASAAPVQGADDATEAPVKGETIVIGTRQPSALERAAAALEKHNAAEKAKPADDDKEVKASEDKPKDKKPEKEGEADKDKKADAEKPKDAEKPAEEKKPEEEKKDPRLAKGLAILVEREERARKIEARAQLMIRDAEAKVREAETKVKTFSAADQADLDIVRAARAAMAKSGHLAAIRAIIPDFDVRKAAELAGREIEPSPEDLRNQSIEAQRRIVREELEARDKARAEAESASKKSAEERAAAYAIVQRDEFLSKIFRPEGGKFVPVVDMEKYPFMAIRGATGQDLWNARNFIANELGRAPSHTEVLERVERDVRKEYEVAAAKLSAATSATATAEAPKPAPAAKISETPKPKATAKKEEAASEEQQIRRPNKRESASARAEAALKRLGL